MKRFFVSLLFLVFLGFGCLSNNQESTDSSTDSLIDREQILLEAKQNGLIMNDAEILKMADSAVLMEDVDTLAVSGDRKKALLEQEKKKWKSAALADVTAGESYGLAFSTSENDRFSLVATFGGLPALRDDQRFDGWLVKRGEAMQVIYLGAAKQMDEENRWSLVYETSEDVSLFDFFVFTLESGDENSAPEQHLLEGRFE